MYLASMRGAFVPRTEAGYPIPSAVVALTPDAAVQAQIQALGYSTPLRSKGLSQRLALVGLLIFKSG
jgi:hypothetical protein